ncbi:MAG: thiamine phosphate synthase [Acidobacteriota bacterium]|nr:thiamine phosphate synthase [Acidobacteriota bacterium]
MAKALPELLAISDLRSLQGRTPEAWLEEIAKDGVRGLLLREKHLAERELYELASFARQCLAPPAVVLLHGAMLPEEEALLAVARATGCDGIHLASGPESPSSRLLRLRESHGAEIILGASTHHAGEVADAAESGADYVFFGPVYPTPSKAPFGPPPGLAGLLQALETTQPGHPAEGLAVYALGGVNAERLSELAEAGAHGAAAIRMFQDPEQRRQALSHAPLFRRG